MVCDPNTLSQLSSCIRCLTNSQLIFVRTFLLCQWAQQISSSTPSAPTNPDITSDSTAANIVVTWTNPTPVGTTNEVWKSTDNITFNLFATVSGATNQAVDATSLNAGAFFYYKIRSCNGSNCSPFSNTISAVSLYVSPNVASISFPTLVRAFGIGTSFMATGLAALTSVSLPALKRVDGNLDLSGNANLTSVTLTALQNIPGGSLFLGSDKITGAFSLPSLVSTGGDIQLQSNTLMTSFSAPSLTSIGGIGSFSGCSALASVTLTNLATVGLNVGGRLDFSSDTSLTALSLPALTSVGDYIAFSGCTLLASVSLTSLTSVSEGGSTFGFSGNACPALVTFNAPNVIITNNGGVITFNADGLNAASINQILARCVASGLTNSDIELGAGTNAPPSGQGVNDKATLIANGNTVNTN
jgi:hypothetical protein